MCWKSRHGRYKVKIGLTNLKRVCAMQRNINTCLPLGLSVIDSWGKLPEGILRGHVNAMGDFDECIGVQGVISDSESSETVVKGK